MEATELTWAEEMIEQGRERGLERGRERGLEQGREQGALSAKREIALVQLRARFGPLDPAIEARIATADEAALDRVLVRLVQMQSFGEVVSGL